MFVVIKNGKLQIDSTVQPTGGFFVYQGTLEECQEYLTSKPNIINCIEVNYVGQTRLEAAIYRQRALEKERNRKAANKKKS